MVNFQITVSEGLFINEKKKDGSKEKIKNPRKFFLKAYLFIRFSAFIYQWYPDYESKVTILTLTSSLEFTVDYKEKPVYHKAVEIK
jgi:hypothetical protein